MVASHSTVKKMQLKVRSLVKYYYTNEKHLYGIEQLFLLRCLRGDVVKKITILFLSLKHDQMDCLPLLIMKAQLRQ